MSRNQKTYLFAAIIFFVYLAIVFAVAFLVPGLSASRTIFIVVLSLVGLVATIVAVIYKRKAIDPNAPANANEIDNANLAALVQSAESRMKQGKGAAKSLGAMPLVYILGDENAGKTQTVLQSGLDAELLAGQVSRDGLVPPTQLANIWYTSAAAIVEAGGTLLRQPGLWYRLVSLTAPSKLGAAFSKGALQSTRAAIVCVSTERILIANSSETVRALGQALNEQLRLLSSALGITLPVYVLFTKLDTIPSFADYVANLTDLEVRDPFGSLLAQPQAGAGLYAETATAQVSQRFDELCYSLAEFRLEVLARGGDPAALARAYEFPRELRKLRSNIVDLLVEAGRPSQLGVNHFLRGFYFIGMRARIVEDNFAPAPLSQAPPVSSDAGATRVFSFNAPVTPAAPVAPRAGTRRVPQWVFLPHLFSRVFLADRGALETSRSSTRVNVVKRLLIGSVAACVLLCLIAFTVSWFNDNALEGRLRAAAALPVQSVTQGGIASTEDLQNLEKLRSIFVDVAGYKKNGPPFSYSWGLYPGDKLYNAACAAYGTHFRTLLLQPTQGAILKKLNALPIATPPVGDYSAAYRPLRAYLITAVADDHRYSTADTESEALQEAWIGDRVAPPDTDLALAQFKTYSADLAIPSSCLARFGEDSQRSTVSHAQQYLAGFQGPDQVYFSMKNAADAKNRGVRFDDKFPEAKPYVSDSYLVEGAFTRGGYDFMMDAIAHPEKYASGEEWVLGKAKGEAPPIGQLVQGIPERYRKDFIEAWRTYLEKASVVRALNFNDAYVKISQLSGNQSALLKLFQLVSQNTGGLNSTFSQPFQAPQSLVPPPAVALPSSSAYTAILSTLASALNVYNSTPNSQHDVVATTNLGAAAAAAENSVNGIAGAFPHDSEFKIDDTAKRLLLEPIPPVKELVKAALVTGGDGPAQAFCGQAKELFKKFPFSPEGAADASMDEAANIFQPGTGAFSRLVAAESASVSSQNGSYAAIPGAPIAAGPTFVRFLNSAQALTNALFPSNGNANLSFSLKQQTVSGLPQATLDIDGKKLSSANTTMPFDWHPSASSTVQLSTSSNNSNVWQGPWSLFHFAYAGKHASGYQIEKTFSVDGVTTKVNGVPLVYLYDVTGPAAPLLNPDFMRKSFHVCPTKVAQ